MRSTQTVRRDALLRKVRAGLMEARTSNFFQDGMPYEEPSKEWRPARVMATGRDHQPGFYNLFESDFRSGVGAAWKEEGTNIVTLYVHSNYSLYLRPKEDRHG